MTDPEAKVHRRGFLKILSSLFAAVGLGAIVGPAIAFFWPSKLEEMPSEPVSVGSEGAIPQGAAKTVRFGRYPALVINTPERGIVAYSAVCTHFACLVKWNPESKMIECPCHEGYFNAVDGSVISGPPPTPLEEIRVTIVDGNILIGGEA
ncbi:MAG: ubiquinol-cytochrome c reductase iron-sulfur subunit [Anaerolineales bacterium]|nr:MAG: ubiquinol-cytochrome c reductase iron-sulfur subunit [Anaerolineales bacterium]